MRLLDWGPALVLCAGAGLVQGVGEQRRMPLREPLDRVVPSEIAGVASRNIAISDEEQRVAGMSSYVMRIYGASAGAPPAFTVYVGYYESQTGGRTIHSPKNCLPGAGWEAIGASTVALGTASGPVTVNRYVLQREGDRALVLYWYQGRGRVAASEYAVKLDLLRDAALSGRSEEALVRVMVPILGTEAEAQERALQVAGVLVPAVYRALPED